MVLTTREKEILNRLQNDFPLTVAPYKDIAAAMGISEEEVIKSIRRLKEAGIIRRIGAVFDSPAMGFASTLCAMQVPEDKLERAAAMINQHKGVTHNYLRDNSVFNLWFTVTAPSRQELQEILTELERESGLEIHRMPTKKAYKIKAVFEIGE